MRSVLVTASALSFAPAFALAPEPAAAPGRSGARTTREEARGSPVVLLRLPALRREGLRPLAVRELERRLALDLVLLDLALDDDVDVVVAELDLACETDLLAGDL